jgi:hypothetical protein
MDVLNERLVRANNHLRKENEKLRAAADAFSLEVQERIRHYQAEVAAADSHIQKIREQNDRLIARGFEDLHSENEKMREALRSIAGGYAMKSNGGPELLVLDKHSFRHGMWVWSQKMAREALAAEGV